MEDSVNVWITIKKSPVIDCLTKKKSRNIYIVDKFFSQTPHSLLTLMNNNNYALLFLLFNTAVYYLLAT